MPIFDGDEPREDGLPNDRENSGHYIIHASHTEKPDVVDKELQPIIDRNQIYDGMFAYASLKFYPYVNRENKPVIGCAIGPIMKIADGESIPKELSQVQRAFSGIDGIKPQAQKTPRSKKGTPNAKDTRLTDIQADVSEQKDETPLWLDENYQMMLESMKDRKMSLDEFKRIAEELSGS